MKQLLCAVGVLIAMQAAPATENAQAAGPWYEVSGGAWRVPASVIADMRRRIDGAAREAVPRSATKEVGTVAGDTVQYQGIKGEKTGRRVIELYGMCETMKSPSELRKSWQSTMDGGNCYYWARYDPDLRKFISFNFNGAA